MEGLIVQPVGAVHPIRHENPRIPVNIGDILKPSIQGQEGSDLLVQLGSGQTLRLPGLGYLAAAPTPEPITLRVIALVPQLKLQLMVPTASATVAEPLDALASMQMPAPLTHLKHSHALDPVLLARDWHRQMHAILERQATTPESLSFQTRLALESMPGSSLPPQVSSPAAAGWLMTHYLRQDRVVRLRWEDSSAASMWESAGEESVALCLEVVFANLGCVRLFLRVKSPRAYLRFNLESTPSVKAIHDEQHGFEAALAKARLRLSGFQVLLRPIKAAVPAPLQNKLPPQAGAPFQLFLAATEILAVLAEIDTSLSPGTSLSPSSQ